MVFTVALQALAYEKQRLGARNVYQDSIAATNLLGSHFGVPGLPNSYDYIVVGGGTAGAALASRLAENSSLSIALIEAGGFNQLDNGNYSQIPANAVYFVEAEPVVRNPLIDWYQFTTPQPVMIPSLEQRRIYAELS